MQGFGEGGGCRSWVELWRVDFRCGWEKGLWPCRANVRIVGDEKAAVRPGWVSVDEEWGCVGNLRGFGDPAKDIWWGW